MVIFTELDNIERILLNLAFLINILFRIKAILLEPNHSLPCNVGVSIYIDIQTYLDWRLVQIYGVSSTNSKEIRSKNESLVSKKSVRIYIKNLGLPKV
jgi:hypothetical protein